MHHYCALCPLPHFTSVFWFWFCVLLFSFFGFWFWVFETGFLCIYLAGFELKRTAQVLGSKACVTIPAGFIFRNGLTL